MRTHHSLATTLLSRLMAAALLLTTACDQGDDAGLDCQDGACAEDRDELAADEPTEAQTLAFSKELVVTDGVNEVRLLVASEQEALLADYDDSTFEIVPIFERPERTVITTDDDEAIDPPHDFGSAVLVEEQSVTLEEGAIGYELRQQGSGFRNGIQSCTTPNIYTSQKDFAWVTVRSGSSSCAESRISTRKYSWSWYEEKAHATLCGGMNLDAGKANTNRVKLEVCPGPAYSYGFYN